MKLIKNLSFVIVLMTIFSFTVIETSDVIGKYGDKEAVKMELNLLEKGVFIFSDNSDEASPKAYRGDWSLEKNVITLSNYGDEAIPNTWKYDEKEGALKSRKGMTFYRLAETGKAKSCCSSKGDGKKSCGDKK